MSQSFKMEARPMINFRRAGAADSPHTLPQSSSEQTPPLSAPASRQNASISE